MITNFKLIIFVFFAAIIGFSGCTEKEYSLGELKAPSNLVVNAEVVGVDTENPNGNGTGNVFISVSASERISYIVDFGDGKDPIILHSDTMTYRYTKPGTDDYTISVKAIGVGGMITTLGADITVFVNFVVPEQIIAALTGTGSKVWVTNNDATGHFGVGPVTDFTPIWYAAGPNTREPEAYDDEITFRKDEFNNIYMTVDNKGASFITGFATAFYGFSGEDGAYTLDTGGEKKLLFSDADSGSSADVSTQIQFEVPGNGIVNFGTGGTTYEIISITDASINIRNVGADGNAWYQILKPKP